MVVLPILLFLLLPILLFLLLLLAVLLLDAAGHTYALEIPLLLSSDVIVADVELGQRPDGERNIHKDRGYSGHFCTYLHSGMAAERA
jgi:hypothetical protein